MYYKLWQTKKYEINYIMSFLIIYGFMLLRQTDRIIYPTLWAEDGAIFLFRTITYGFKSILMPYASYLQVFPQIISLTSYIISLKYYPILTLCISSFIYTYAIAIILRRSYEWISDSLMVRLCCILVITFMPGTPEILGDLSNLHAVLFLFVMIRLIASIEEKYSIFDFILFIMAIFSAGEIILALPLMVYKIFILFKNKMPLINISLEVILLLLILTATVINISFFEHTSFASGHGFLYYLLLFKNYLPFFMLTTLNRFIFLPFVGSLTIVINKSIILSLIIGVGLLWFIYSRFKNTIKIWTYHYNMLCIAIFSYVGLILLTVFARPGAELTPFMGKLDSINQLQYRYMTFLIPIAILFWYVIINNILTDRGVSFVIRRKIILFISLYIMVINSYTGLIFRNFYVLGGGTCSKQNLWNYNYPTFYKVIKVGDPKTINIPFAPDPKMWKVQISHDQLYNYNDILMWK